MSGFDTSKYAYENEPFDVEFIDLADGDTINLGLSSVTAIDEEGTDQSGNMIGTITTEGKKLLAWISNGEAGKRYTISFKAESAAGWKQQHDFTLLVI